MNGSKGEDRWKTLRKPSATRADSEEKAPLKVYSPNVVDGVFSESSRAGSGRAGAAWARQRNPYNAAMISSYDLADIQIIVDIVQKLFTIAAIIVGGMWAYFNFFKRRTYTMRLEPEVSGEVVTINGVSHLIATIHLKNVGLSKVKIEQEGSALQVLSYEAPASTKNILSADWDDLAAFPDFEAHGWLEPGEEVKEERLLVMPRNGRTAYQLRLRVVSNGIAWKVIDIVTLSEEANMAEG
jgi:hypothetical protein